MHISKRNFALQGAFSLVLACTLNTPVMAMQGSHAQVLATDVQDQEKSQPPAPATDPTSKPIVLTGVIVKNGSDYFLREARGTLYQLDDSDKAQPFEGKTAKVSGTLEANTSLVHVDTIEPL